MTKSEYYAWWLQNAEVIESLPEPVRTLALHVEALQGRIDDLMDPEEHDILHGTTCGCNFVRCCCSYDHPDAVCLLHARQEAKGC
jgi:hypothetical protein